MENIIWVSGHKSPDTDTICSALACAYMLEQEGKAALAVRAGELNKETQYALAKFGVAAPELKTAVPAGQPIVLVDHNESKQALDGLKEADVVGLIDHHRLGDLETEKPVFMLIEPVGCTATILLDLMQRRGIEIPQAIAGLMLSAIISDTLLFRSPTCTERDRKAVEELARLAGVNYEEYGMDMLKAGADVSDLQPADMVQTDKKEFAVSNGTISIAQLSVMDTAPVLAQKDVLLRELEADRAAHSYEASFLMVTDILEEGTQLLFAGDAAKVAAAFGGEALDGAVHLPGVMSRKKQVAPPLLGAF